MKLCARYDTTILSRFVDDELDADTNAAVSHHLESCPECGRIVMGFQRVAKKVNQAIHSAVLSADTRDMEEIVLERMMRSRTASPWDRAFGWLFRKNVLQMATIVAIIVSSWVYVHYRPVEITGPSAIVTSVDGNVSSVMILETRGEHQTIIWFKET